MLCSDQMSQPHHAKNQVPMPSASLGSNALSLGYCLQAAVICEGFQAAHGGSASAVRGPGVLRGGGPGRSGSAAALDSPPPGRR